VAKQFDRIEEQHRDFILRQRIFFTASAAEHGRVNVSPKGLDAFRILGENEICYLDLTGSGNETSAHLAATGRLTVMFCAFEGPPLILRLYGQGEVLRLGTPEFERLATLFDDLPGRRQIVRLRVDLVQTSCGYGVPHYAYQGERPSLLNWAEAKGEDGLAAYRQKNNTLSIDGLPTGLEPAQV